MQRFFAILADAVDRASRAPSTSSPATGSWPCSAPRSPTRTTPGAPVTRRCGCSRTSPSTPPSCAATPASTSRPGSGSTPARWSPGRSARERRRLHGDRPHRRPGAADGGAGRARHGLPDRGDGRARRAASSSSRTSASSRSRAPADRSGVYELAGVGAARSRLDLARARGLSALRRPRRGAGRARGRARAAAQAGEGGVVGIVAEPGVGKSRLCPRVRRARRGRGVEVFEAQAQAHGGSIPFLPILQMLRAFFGDRRARAPSRRRARRSPAAPLLLDPDFADDLPLLFDFLGVPDPERPVPQMQPGGAPARASPTSSAASSTRPARRKTAGAAGRGPALDRPGERGDAGRAGRRGRRARRRWSLVNFRPEYAPPWAGAPGYRELRAGAARPPRDTAALLRDVAGADPSLDGLDEPIHERTGGNPFFIEEIVRELAESGYLEGERGRLPAARRPIEDAGVPATVQAILAARIDRLDADGEGAAAGRLGGRQARSATEALGVQPPSSTRRPPSGAARGADRRRLPLRGRALPRAGARLPPPADPRGRLRQPARPSGAQRPTRRRPRATIELEGGAPGGARRAGRPPLRAGRRAARGGALVRRAPPTAPATASRARRCGCGGG